MQDTYCPVRQDPGRCRRHFAQWDRTLEDAGYVLPNETGPQICSVRQDPGRCRIHIAQ
jgi:hypothetical protein